MTADPGLTSVTREQRCRLGGARSPSKPPGPPNEHALLHWIEGKEADE